jgi:ABC-type transport system involved in multi-copper enzyme maturation permease subunit
VILALTALVGRSLARVRGTLLGLAALLSALQVAIVLQAASYDQPMFETLGRLTPEFIQRWLGDNIVALASFGGLVAFGYFHPVVMLLVAMVAAFVASELAADVEGGHVDLLLSRPIARHWLVTRSAVLSLASPLILAALMIASTWVAVAAFAPSSARGPSAVTIVTLAAHLVAVAWCFGALALTLAGVVRRRAAAFVPAAIAAVGLFFVNLLAASWRPARVVDVFSPFHYYQGAAIIAGLSSPARDLFLLGSTALVLTAVSYWRFRTRDL